jgi:hypothetical protein
LLLADVSEMSEAEVSDFREMNKKIVVTNFDENSTAEIMKPTPNFHHAFHNFPDILNTIAG